MPLRDGFFSTATQTSCCNRIQRSNRVRLLVVSTHDFPDTGSLINMKSKAVSKLLRIDYGVARQTYKVRSLVTTVPRQTG